MDPPSEGQRDCGQKEDVMKKLYVEEGEREWKGDLIHFTYDQLADGGRAKKPSKKIDPETEKAIKIAFDIK